MDGEQQFFRSKALAAPAPGHGEGEERASWGRVFADLIRAGHSRESLGNYTGRQLTLFWREAEAAEKRQQARDLRAVMFGMVGGKEANAFLKKLES